MSLELTNKTFDEEVFSSEKPVVVDFWADWCMPCKMLAPVLEAVEEENPQVKFAKVNISEYPDIAEKFGVMSIPTLILFKDGDNIDASVGLISKAEIEKFIDQ